MKRMGVLTKCALRLISYRIRMESYFSVARDSATLFGVGAMTKEDAARGRWHLRRQFIVPSLLAYLHALTKFVTKPFCRVINLILSAGLASIYHLKSLQWCFQARGFTDSRLCVHFGVYFKMNIQFYSATVVAAVWMKYQFWDGTPCDWVLCSRCFATNLMALPSRVMTLEGKAITLSQHVGNQVPADSTSHPERTDNLKL
jgi:hypothetical protein